MARKPATDTRERILRTASRLFNQYGVRAVGMQQVVEETGLGKSLLYREFPSKDELVAAWVREMDAEWWKGATAVTDPYQGDPTRQLLAVVEYVYDSVKAPEFRVCAFYHTLGEFREVDHPGRRAAVSHLRAVREYLYQLAWATNAREPRGLADTLMLIIGGALTNGTALGADGPANSAVPAAQAIINLHCGPTTAGQEPARAR